MSNVWPALKLIRGTPLLVFVTCVLGWMLTTMDQSLFGYAIPGIRAEFGAGIDDVGWILGATFLFTAIATTTLGALTDRYGRKRMFVICLSVSAFLVAMQAFVAGLVSLTVLRMVSSGFSNGIAPIAGAYVAESSPPRVRGFLLGLFNTGYPLGWFVASLFVAPMLTAFGWRYIFFPALIVIPIALLLARNLPESARFIAARAQEKEHPQSLFAKLRALFAPDLRRKTVICFFCFALFGGGYAGTAFYLPSYFHEVRGYTMEDATSIVGLSYGVGLIGYVLVSFLSEFVITRRNVAILWALLGAVATIGLLWFSDSHSCDVIWFTLMTGFFYGNAAILGALLAEIFPTRVRATAIGFAGSTGLNVGQAIAPVIVAWAIKHIGWQWAFTLVVVPSMCIVALLLLQLRNVPNGLDIDEIAA